ncbi:MAG: D-2-hydroxyacid dehydrogenase, partial [Clostridia bacterium]|nr:D-2-hydroxyacid dehydrogenase [Clostridia bacterium]
SLDGDIEYVDRETLLRESDFISFHCPLNDETRGLVNRDFISHTKCGVFLINTSRGAVINEKDLAEALESGRVAGAGLDVLTTEPPLPDNPLLHLDNCIVTPHCAWTSLEARKRLIGIIDRNIDSFVRTGRGITEVGI